MSGLCVALRTSLRPRRRRHYGSGKMAEAVNALKAFGLPLRRGLHTPDGTVIDQVDMHITEDVHTQHRIRRHGGWAWNVTTSTCPAAGLETLFLDYHTVFVDART